MNDRTWSKPGDVWHSERGTWLTLRSDVDFHPHQGLYLVLSDVWMSDGRMFTASRDLSRMGWKKVRM